VSRWKSARHDKRAFRSPRGRGTPVDRRRASTVPAICSDSDRDCRETGEIADRVASGPGRILYVASRVSRIRANATRIIASAFRLSAGTIDFEEEEKEGEKYQRQRILYSCDRYVTAIQARLHVRSARHHEERNHLRVRINMGERNLSSEWQDTRARSSRGLSISRAALLNDLGPH